MLNSNINKTLEINSNKAVLLSIKKQWLEKILSGEKTVEVRKTMPWEISYPFVVFCYETKANGGAGKVTTLDCLRELPAYAIGTEVTEKTAQFVKDSCLTANELIAYGNKSGTLYCWNVSDVQSMDMSLRELGVKQAPQSWMYLRIPDNKTF